MPCGAQTLIQAKPDTVKAVRLRCHAWTCKHCCPRRKRRLIKEGNLGKPTKFITLTVNPHRFDTPDEAAVALSLAWRRAREQLKRYHDHDKIEAFMVFEQTKAGWPHLHILCRSDFISQQWLSDYMNNRIGAPIVDVRTIRGRRQVAAYVAKYMGKNPHKFSGTKRYWRTANYLPPRARKPRPAHPWRVSSASLERWFINCTGGNPPIGFNETEAVELKPPDWM